MPFQKIRFKHHKEFNQLGNCETRAEVTYVVDYGITQEEGRRARNTLRQLLKEILN